MSGTAETRGGCGVVFTETRIADSFNPAATPGRDRELAATCPRTGVRRLWRRRAPTVQLFTAGDFLHLSSDDFFKFLVWNSEVVDQLAI